MKLKPARETVAGEEGRSGPQEDGRGTGKLALWRNRAAAQEGGDGGHGGVRGETVVVGVRLDAESRELLTWALVKVAEPGDRVIAFHVLPDCRSSHTKPTSCSSLIALIRSFDAMLTAYEGFCNLKQIDLKLKICRGSSLRKVLVSEVKSFEATKLVLGVAKHCHAIGSSTSVAKYCAKKLPRECSVLAASNGRILFQRESKPPSSPISHSTDIEKAANSLHRMDLISDNNNESIKKRDTDLETSLASEEETGKDDTSSVQKFDVNKTTTCGCDDGSELALSPSKLRCSIRASVLMPSRLDRSSQAIQQEEDSSLICACPSFLSHFAENLEESRHGWPLPQTVLNDNKSAAELPAYYSIFSVEHLDYKSSRSVSMAAPGLDNKNVASGPLAHDQPHMLNTAHPGGRWFAEGLESLQLKYSSNCRLFSYDELKNATTNFSADKLVGKGGSSHVFKGYLSDGKEVAVKILQKSEDLLRDFILEVDITTTLHHKNIISLFGFCFENENFILVYDFLSQGSLEDMLHGEESRKASFGWVDRYKVATGLSEALDYLHGAGIAKAVIHRDVKSSNVLLSDDFEPQLSDFGLAKWASSTSSHITCNDVAGTFGYLAPEYFMYGKVNEKIDVYAFGVVLLELLTGKKPINTGPKGQESLVMWATPILQSGKAMQLLDPSLGDNYDKDQVERAILAALLCIRKAPQSRPTMGLALKLLQGDEDIIKWAKMQVNSADLFDGLDDESASPAAMLHSHLSLALHDVESDSFSETIREHTADHIMSQGSIDDYIQYRWSQSSSFD